MMGDMYALTSIENIGKYLARAVHSGTDIEAHEHVAFANNLSGVVMSISSCTSEHAMSAYHENLPHGAGLIMISSEYFTYFVNKHVCDERYVRMAQALGMKDASKPEDFITALLNLQKACGVDNLKMSGYGITIDEAEKFSKNAHETMGGLFLYDRTPLDEKDCAEIYLRAYK
ncbi:MAG TPA: hypothetical protein DCL73_15685 [Treponema sp.]|nr:hypothetical protein [Treponema sp.]